MASHWCFEFLRGGKLRLSTIHQELPALIANYATVTQALQKGLSSVSSSLARQIRC